MRRIRLGAVRGMLLIAALPLLGGGCELPNNLIVNLISQGASTATNGFVGALVNAFTGQLFGTVGGAPIDGGGNGDEGDDHDDGDEH